MLRFKQVLRQLHWIKTPSNFSTYKITTTAGAAIQTGVAVKFQQQEDGSWAVVPVDA